jgi:hypothetical protein
MTAAAHVREYMLFHSKLEMFTRMFYNKTKKKIWPKNIQKAQKKTEGFLTFLILCELCAFSWQHVLCFRLRPLAAL